MTERTSRHMETVDGKVAFVTGGASGIGLGIVRALIERGAKVAVGDIRDDHLAALRTMAAQAGWGEDRIWSARLDITDRPGFAAVLEQAQARLGPLSILVNNAGVGIAGPIVEAAHADWDWGISVNLTGVTNGIVAGLPLILAHGQGGHIVNTASLGALMPARPTRGIYAATKAAVVALSEHLRLDLADTGVGVSVLLPGPTKSNIAQSGKVRPAHLREGSAFARLEAQPRGAGAPPNIVWMDPLIAGRMTVEAILADRLYIVTHPEYMNAVKARHAAIEDAIAATIVPA